MKNSFKVLPSQLAVLAGNVMICKDADCDAERTADELLTEIDSNNGWLSKKVLEAALFTCNCNDEDDMFYHPLGWGFVRFLNKLLPPEFEFDRYYNQIRAKDAKS